MTIHATFSLMRSLTTVERDEIECRYDGPIPADAAIPSFSMPADPLGLDRMRCDLEFAAQQNRTMAWQLLRSAKRCKAFGVAKQDPAERRRHRQTVAGTIDDIRRARGMAAVLRAQARKITLQLTAMMDAAAASRAAAE